MGEHGVEDLDKWLKWFALESRLNDNLLTWSNVTLDGSKEDRDLKVTCLKGTVFLNE